MIYERQIQNTMPSPFIRPAATGFRHRAANNTLPNLLKSTDSVQFSGNSEIEENGLTLATSFFRDPAALEQVADRLRQIAKTNPARHFDIADYACSSGEEAFSLAMLLKNRNLNYSLTGYDIAESALETAKRGEVGINNPAEYLQAREKESLNNLNTLDTILFVMSRLKHTQFQDRYLSQDNTPPDEPLQKKYYDLFHQHFQKQEAASLPERAVYQLKPNASLGCDFQVGNIQDIEKKRGQNSTDVLLFRNALYHLITQPANQEAGGIRKPLSSVQAVNQQLDDLFQQFYQVLSPDGILVMGEKENAQHQQKELVDSALARNGFQPLSDDDKSLPIYVKKPGFRPEKQ